MTSPVRFELFEAKATPPKPGRVTATVVTAPAPAPLSTLRREIRLRSAGGVGGGRMS